MRCSVCESELIKGEGLKGYMTLGEHVSDPNQIPPDKEYYVCSDDECITRKTSSYWDPYGAFYSSDFRTKFEFKDGWHPALGSPARKDQVEIYKKDENFTFLNLWFFKFNWIWEYEADEDGKILKRKLKLEVWKRIKGGGYVGYISGIRMFFFCLRRLKEKISWYLEKPSEFNKNQLVREFKPDWKDKRWWKRLYQKWINFRYRKFRKQLLEEV